MKHAFRDPLTNSVVTGSVEEIVRKVLAFRQSKGIPADRTSIYREVIAYIQGKNKAVKRHRRDTISFREALAAGKAAVKIASGQTVSKAEMERRWKICENCPMKGGIKECFKCNAARYLSQITHSVASVFGVKTHVPPEAKKHSCDVCKCMLPMLLPARSSDMHKDTKEQSKKRPDFCWMSRGGPNYKES